MTAESLYDFKKRYTVAAVFKRRYLRPGGGFNWLSLRRDVLLAVFIAGMTLLSGLTALVSPLLGSPFAAIGGWFLTAVYIHFYYAGIERQLWQFPGLSETSRSRMVATARLISFSLFFFLLSAVMHAAAVAYITSLQFDLPGSVFYDRLPVLGILSITYLSLMFGLASFGVRMKPAPRSERAAKLALLALLFCACSSLGGYVFGFYQGVYVILAAFSVPFLYVLGVAGLSLVIRIIERRAVLAEPA
ncbi:hypothetical protein F4X86_00120 [Candidatus Saccharibacteria bacterium]|nr:hypothetical protein [Candidatus Saccharibacteria bacterium]